MAFLLRFLTFMAVAATAIFFAVMNRQDALVSWSPFHEAVSLPVFFIGLGGMGIGFLIGCVYTWINHHKVRRERRQYKKEIKTLEKELAEKDAELRKHTGDTQVELLPENSL